MIATRHASPFSIGSDVRGVAVGKLGNLRVDLGLVDGKRGKRNLDGIVRGELVFWLGADLQGEAEILIALEGRARRGMWRKRGNDAALVDGHGSERLEGVCLDDGIEVLDAHLFLGDLLDGLAGLGIDAHGVGEVELRECERLVDVIGAGGDFEDDLAIRLLDLAGLHEVNPLPLSCPRSVMSAEWLATAWRTHPLYAELNKV